MPKPLINRGPWAMLFDDWRGFRDQCASVELAAAKSMQIMREPLGYVLDGNTAIINVYGPLMPSMPWWAAAFDIDATGYDELTAAIIAATADKGAENIRLNIESPGGTVDGIFDVIGAIGAARKMRTVTAHTNSLCASAAYWLASQCDRITAGEGAQVGCIGVYTIVDDDSRAWANEGVDVHIIRSGINKGYHSSGVEILPENLQAEQETVDGFASKFFGDVSAMRPCAGDPSEWGTGQLWLADRAKKLGLVDSVITQKRGKSAATKGVSGMSEDNTIEALTPHGVDALIAEAVERGRAEERARLESLVAAFPDDPAFALAQCISGVDAITAKAAHADVLSARMQEMSDALAAANARAEAAIAAAANTGVAPIPNDNSGGAEMVDVRALAKELKAGGMKGTDAWDKIQREHPDAYRAYRNGGGK